MTNFHFKPAVGRWERNTSRFGTGSIYKIGKVTVGAAFNPIGRKGDPMVWRAEIKLPGIAFKANAKDLATEQEARDRVERAVATWFGWLRSNDSA